MLYKKKYVLVIRTCCYVYGKSHFFYYKYIINVLLIGVGIHILHNQLLYYYIYTPLRRILVVKYYSVVDFIKPMEKIIFIR